MIAGIIVGVIVTVGTIVLTALYGGVVLYMLWGWFLVPLGVPQIGIAWAIGVSAIASLLTPSVPAPDGDKKWEHIFNVIAKPAWVLLVGFVAKQFM